MRIFIKMEMDGTWAKMMNKFDGALKEDAHSEIKRGLLLSNEQFNKRTNLTMVLTVLTTEKAINYSKEKGYISENEAHKYLQELYSVGDCLK